MSLDTNINKNLVIQGFPKLSTDNALKITSPFDTKYNCIAWAANRTDKWWWPIKLDGCHWPIEDMELEFENLIKVFETIGYKICDDYKFDIKLKKVALYKNSLGQFTHASRQLRNGFWTSKLGDKFDITHETPYTIEGIAYGNVGAIMSITF